MVMLAAAVILLMGAAAVAGLSPALERYFAGTPEGEIYTLGQGAAPIGVSQSFNGWSVTLTDCVGDDHNLFIGVEVEAPRGTVLSPRESGSIQFSEYNIDCWSGVQEIELNNWGLEPVPDQDQTDNRYNFVLKVEAVHGFGDKADITLEGFQETWITDRGTPNWKCHEGGELTEDIREHAFVFEKVPLNCEDRTIRLEPNVEVPLFDGTTTLVSLEVSPVTVTARVEGGSCAWHHKESGWGGVCENMPTIVLHMKDGTDVEAVNCISGCGCEPNPNSTISPYGAFVRTVRYYGRTRETYRFIDPTQVAAVEVCGVLLPIPEG